MTIGDDTVRGALTDRMRVARNKGVVALQDYNTLRSQAPGAIVIALEGYNDPIYYKTAIARIDSSFSWTPLVCHGKDKVLNLRILLGRNTDADAKKTFFIVDHDFDHLKNHNPGPDLYCTPGYSIENNLVSEEILVELLHGEYRCSPLSDEVAKIISLFQSRMGEFLAVMEMANRALHYCRLTGLQSGSVEDSIGKYVSISLDKVASKYVNDDLVKLVGLPDKKDILNMCKTSAAFDSLDRVMDWRGKYLLAFFVEFLAKLQEDRSCKVPKVFDNRKTITFNPKSSIIRSLSSISEPPVCLQKFVQCIAA